MLNCLQFQSYCQLPKIRRIWSICSLSLTYPLIQTVGSYVHMVTVRVPYVHMVTVRVPYVHMVTVRVPYVHMVTVRVPYVHMVTVRVL